MTPDLARLGESENPSPAAAAMGRASHSRRLIPGMAYLQISWVTSLGTVGTAGLISSSVAENARLFPDLRDVETLE